MFRGPMFCGPRVRFLETVRSQLRSSLSLRFNRRFSGRRCNVGGEHSSVVGVLHHRGCWRDKFGRIGFVCSLSIGRFDGLGFESLDRFEIGDALQKYPFEVSQRLCVLLRLRALLYLSQGQAQRLQRLVSRSAFNRSNHCYQ